MEMEQVEYKKVEEKAQPTSEEIGKKLSKSATKKNHGVYNCPNCGERMYPHNDDDDTDGDTEERDDVKLQCCESERLTYRYYICDPCDYIVSARYVKLLKKLNLTDDIKGE